MRIVRKGCRDDEQTIIIKGEPGPAGEAATIEIGTVTTLEPEDEAYVINTGDENAAVLNFGIPKGPQGNRGPAGKITIGTVETLDPGEEAYVENVGTETEAELNIGIPRGRDAIEGETSAKNVTVDDEGGYYTSGNVEGALQEIGAELSGINTLIGSGVIT